MKRKDKLLGSEATTNFSSRGERWKINHCRIATGGNAASEQSADPTLLSVLAPLERIAQRTAAGIAGSLCYQRSC